MISETPLKASSTINILNVRKSPRLLMTKNYNTTDMNKHSSAVNDTMINKVQETPFRAPSDIFKSPKAQR